MRGDTHTKTEFTYKNCIYSYTFKLQSPSKYSPFDAIHLSRHFFPCSKEFLNTSILMLFSASAVFLFHLFYISKMFPFEDFSSRGAKNSLRVRSGD